MNLICSRSLDRRLKQPYRIVDKCENTENEPNKPKPNRNSRQTTEPRIIKKTHNTTQNEKKNK